MQSLPQSQYGALIFRDGFKEAVDWMVKEPHEIIICSQMPENKPFQDLYKVNYDDSIILDHCTGAKPELDSNAAFFNYTDSALYISK